MRAHIFLDENAKIVAVADNPDALDEAPYDRMVERRCTVDLGLAVLATLVSGGIVVTASGVTHFPGNGAPSHHTPHAVA